MTDALTILFAGGGTGGHLFPGIAVAEELRRRNDSFKTIFVGSDRAIEASIAAQYQLEHRNLPVESLATLKKNPWRFAVRNWRAWGDSAKLLKELKPAAVIGLGGFASAPLIWEAHRCKIPIVLLEQNVIPGKTTRWLSRWAQKICLTFSASIDRFKARQNIVVTGNPVRSEIASFHSRGSDPALADQPYRTLLILGGSQGADSLNRAVVSTIEQLPGALSGWRIVHQTGPRDVEQIHQTYQSLNLECEVASFFTDMAKRLEASDLIISRAGATSLAELACIGRPMILLPYPQAADDHQRANARVFVEQGAAYLVEHAKTPEETALALKLVLEKLVHDELLRETMGRAAQSLGRPDAAAKVADIVTELITASAKKNP